MEKDTTQLVRKAIKGSKSAYGELITAYLQYMDELKGSPEKIATKALFQTEVRF